MKLMNLPHIAIVLYLTCNFKCSYCVAEASRKVLFYNSKDSLDRWDAQFGGIVSFLNSLDTKAIMVSGGEPFIWKRWGELIERTAHYWYFITNASSVPKWLGDSVVKTRTKLIIATFHRTEMRIERFIDNVCKMQDLGYPVFAKVIYDGDSGRFREIEKVMKAGIPVSFVPFLNMAYSKVSITNMLTYCQSAMYAGRFFPPDAGVERDIKPCMAGTEESFEVDGSVIARCSFYSGMPLNEVPRFLRGLSHRYLGDIHHPRFFKEPKMCYRKTCACEWHTFSDMAFGFENEKWQRFIETGEWSSATIPDIEKFVAMSLNGKEKVGVK